MSEETFESLFTIGVTTGESVKSLTALETALTSLDSKIRGTLELVGQLNGALGGMGAVSFQGTQGPVVPAYVPGVQSGMTPAGTIHSVSSKGFASPTQALAEVAAMRGAFDDIVRLTEMELSKIPIAVRAKMQLSESHFRELKNAVVSRSIIPEMVMEINEWLRRIDTDGMSMRVRQMVDEIANELARLEVTLQSPLPSTVEAVGRFDYSRWWQEQERLTLYHGTTRGSWEQIQKYGLIPPEGRQIYMTPEPGLAWHYAKQVGGESEYRKTRDVAPMEDRVVLRIDIPPKMVELGEWGKTSIFEAKQLYEWQAKALGPWQYPPGEGPFQEFRTREPFGKLDARWLAEQDAESLNQMLLRTGGILSEDIAIPPGMITNITEQFKALAQANIAEWDLGRGAENFLAKSIEDLPSFAFQREGINVRAIAERVQDLVKELSLASGGIELPVGIDMEAMRNVLTEIDDYADVLFNQRGPAWGFFGGVGDDISEMQSRLVGIVGNINEGLGVVDVTALPDKISRMVDRIVLELGKIGIAYDSVLPHAVSQFPRFDISQLWTEQERLTLFTTMHRGDVPQALTSGIEPRARWGEDSPTELFTNPFEAWRVALARFTTSWDELSLLAVRIPPDLPDLEPIDRWLTDLSAWQRITQDYALKGAWPTEEAYPSGYFEAAAIPPEALTDITTQWRAVAPFELPFIEQSFDDIVDVVNRIMMAAQDVVPYFRGEEVAARLHPAPEVPMLEAPALEGEYKLLEGVGAQASAELGTIPAAAAEVVNEVVGQFEKLKEALVGEPIVIDMVREINDWFMQIDTTGLSERFRAMLDDMRYTMTGLMSMLSTVTGDISDLGRLPIDWASDFVPSIQRNIQEITGLLEGMELPVPKALPVSQSISPGLWWQGTDIVKQLGLPYSLKQLTRAEMLAEYGEEESGAPAAGVATHYIRRRGAAGASSSIGGMIRWHEERGGLDLASMMHEITHAFSYTVPQEVRAALHEIARTVLTQLTTSTQRGGAFMTTQQYLEARLGEGYNLPEEVLADAGKALYGGTPAYPSAAGDPQLYEKFAQEQFQAVQDTIRRLMSTMDIESVAGTLALGDTSITPERFSGVANVIAAWERSVQEMLSERLPRLLTDVSLGMGPTEMGPIPEPPDIGAFEEMWPTAMPPTIEGEYKLLEGTGAAAATELQQIPAAAAAATEEAYAQFEKLKFKLVGDPLIPDMVGDINAWLARIEVSPETLAELEASAQRIQSGFAISPMTTGAGEPFPAYYSPEVSAGMSGTPQYIKGVQPGWDAEARRWRTAQGQFTSQQVFMDAYLERLAHAEIEQSAFDWEAMYGPEVLAGMAPPPAPPAQPPYAYNAFVEPATEQYINGELIQRIEKYNEQMDYFNQKGALAATVTREVTTALDKEGNVIKEVTRVVDQDVESGKQVTRTFTQMGDAAEESGKKVSALSSRFLRHFVWIAQGIVLWQGINTIQNFGRAYLDTFSDIEQAAARAAFVIGSTTQDVVRQQQQAAAGVTIYGVEPQEAAGAGLVAARFGVQDAQFMQDAARLAMVAQIDMASATENLISIERTWNMELDDTSRVLDVLATMYAETPRDMQELLDVMREGPSLAAQFGQSFEENMMMISRALTYVPSQTPAGMFGLLQRTVTRITTGETPQILARRYGIGVISPETLAPRPGLQVLDEIAAKYRELQTEQERTALAALIAGTRQGQAWADAKVLLDNWAEIGMRGAQDALREFDELSQNVLQTHESAVDGLTASWKLFTQTLGDSSFVHALDNSIRQLTAMLMISNELSVSVSDWVNRLNLIALMRYSPRNALQLFTRDVQFQQQAKEGTGIFGPLPNMAEDFIQRLLDFFGLGVGANATALTTTRGARGGRGYAATARETGYETFGDFRDRIKSLSDGTMTAAQYLEEFGTTAKNASEELSVWAAMLQAGWTPPTAIVDLTGPKETPYTAAQINQAIAQSRADTQAMIAAYRSFLERQGLGGVAIEEALKNFTDKLEMQLQFFRLPGGEITLAEGRDLLFYLSQIEENTRPLEGIWNVPEGMRVWVPIESTFYGEWRQRQQEAAGEGEITLDASIFESASDRYAQAVDGYRNAVDEFKLAVALQAKLTGQEETTYIPEIGWPYSAEEPLEPAWLIDMEIAVRSFGNYVMQFGDIVPHVYQPDIGYPYSAPQELPPQWLEDIIAAMPQMWQTTDPSLLPSVTIPTPMDVNVNPSAISTGVQTGTIASGMPMAVNSMSTGIRALQTYGITQLTLLAAIVRNTSVAPVINVNLPGSNSTNTGGKPRRPGYTPDTLAGVLTREWLLSSGVYEVP